MSYERLETVQSYASLADVLMSINMGPENSSGVIPVKKLELPKADGSIKPGQDPIYLLRCPYVVPTSEGMTGVQTYPESFCCS